MPRREAAPKSSQKSKAHSRMSLVCQWKRRSPNWPNSASGRSRFDELSQPASLDNVFAIIGPESDRFCLQIVTRLNETHGLAFGAHQDRMRDGRDATVSAHTAQQRAVTDPGCAKKDVL